jgi:hypothetical protein
LDMGEIHHSEGDDNHAMEWSFLQCSSVSKTHFPRHGLGLLLPSILNHSHIYPWLKVGQNLSASPLACPSHESLEQHGPSPPAVQCRCTDAMIGYNELYEWISICTYNSILNTLMHTACAYMILTVYIYIVCRYIGV